MASEQGQQLCPRCELEYFTPFGTTRAVGDPNPPALSRVGDVYICSTCGTGEALLQAAGEVAPPPEQWPIDPNLWQQPVEPGSEA